jgi:peptide chain release factor 3
MKNQYNSDVIMEPIGSKIPRWIEESQVNESLSSSRSLLVKDRFDKPLFLFENDFALRWFQDKNPGIKLSNPME